MEGGSLVPLGTIGHQAMVGGGSGHLSHHHPCGYSPQEFAVVQLVARGHPAGTEHNDLPPILVVS